MQLQPTVNTNIYQALEDWFVSRGLQVIPTGTLNIGRKWVGLYKGRTLGSQNPLLVPVILGVLGFIAWIAIKGMFSRL